MYVIAKLAMKRFKLFQELIFAEKVLHSRFNVVLECHKCVVLSDIVTISSLHNPCELGTVTEELSLKYNNLLLFPLNIISY